VCTDDRDADDLFLFGLDWVVRSAVKAGSARPPPGAWARSTPRPASAWTATSAAWRRRGAPTSSSSTTRSEPQCTWYGGEFVVRNRRITPVLDKALSRRYRYPRAAYKTVVLPARPVLLARDPAARPVTANVIRTRPGDHPPP
jgi:adenine deaminase